MDNIYRNRWRLGGLLIDRYRDEIDDRGLANILTLLRGDGSRYELELFGEVAERASATNRGDFLVLAGMVGKEMRVPEGRDIEREFVQYDVTEIEPVDEHRARISCLELGGVITEWDKFTKDGSPVYRLKLRHGSTDWVFAVDRRVAVAAQPLAVVGRRVVVDARFGAKPVEERNLDGRWLKRQIVTGLKAPDDCIQTDRKPSPVAA